MHPIRHCQSWALPSAGRVRLQSLTQQPAHRAEVDQKQAAVLMVHQRRMLPGCGWLIQCDVHGVRLPPKDVRWLLVNWHRLRGTLARV